MVNKVRSITLRIDARELATILAALRFHPDENLQGDPGLSGTSVQDIASNSGMLKPLDFHEMNALCQRLNVPQACPHRVIQNPSTTPYQRTWKCPDCGFSTTCSYEDLAEAGAPICTDCDIEMELQ
jgi:hypothetical protein